MSYPKFSFGCLSDLTDLSASSIIWHFILIRSFLCRSTGPFGLLPFLTLIFSSIFGLCHTLPLPRLFLCLRPSRNPDFSPSMLFPCPVPEVQAHPAPLYYGASLCIHPPNKIIYNLPEYKFQLLYYTFFFQFTLIFSFSKTLQLI